jgi:putative phosphonate metabolism protein
MIPTAPRYAVYFTPDAKSDLWRFGSRIIGHDAYLGSDIPHTVPSGFDMANWARLTEEPRRYGFHATLKAPFHLAVGKSELDFCAAVEAFARETPVVGLGPLAVRVTSGFAALYNDGPAEEVSNLASQIVKNLEPFRAPLSDYDRKRRLSASLTEKQKQYLEAFGYPYVLDQFRFHMTLTGRLSVEARQPVELALAAAWSALQMREPTTIDALSVLRQDGRDERFRVIARLPLRSPMQSPAEPS